MIGSSSSSGSWTHVVLSAGVLSFVMIGDALIYVVLPARPETFGVSLAWVGVLLAANRLIRLVGYAWVLRLIDRIGLRTAMIAAAALAVATTLSYGLAQGWLALLIARIFWGLSFATINLAALAYATDAASAIGKRVGINRAVRWIGSTLAVSLGAYGATVIGVQEIFVVLGLISLLALPLAWALPRIDRRPPVERSVWSWPNALNRLLFTISFSVDGVTVIAMTALYGGVAPGAGASDAAIIATGLTLTVRPLVTMALAPAGGWLADRWGADRMVVGAVSGMVVGLVLVGANAIEIGLVLVIASRGVLETVVPTLVTQRRPEDRLGALATNATWFDLGAALGPMAGAFLVASVPQAWLFGTMAALIALALLPEWRSRRTPIS
jgi:MFS family permease